ncbi:MAG: RNA-guided endonuclease IscB [Microcystaceae cyanobacterium]
MSNYVLVLNANKDPVNPVHPAQARRLLTERKAAVFRRYPLTIILKKEITQTPDPITLKLDPGSRVTGISLVQGNRVIWGAELSHRGQQIKDALTSRRQLRRSRRNRKTRYRQPRFLNRKRSEGWLAPSLIHRVFTTLTWVKKLIKFATIDSITMELVRFDTQALDRPEISGIEYQQGKLMGYELREYLLEKFNRACQYCGAKNVPLQVEHIVPKSKGGSNRVSNLTLACEPCNRAKGNQDIQDFLLDKPDLLARIIKQAKAPLKDAAAVNSTRWALFNSLQELGLPVTRSSGGETKFNRLRLNLNKAHWIDSACVGEIPDNLVLKTAQPLLIKSTGHGTRQMCRTNQYGFPIRYVPRFKFVKGFQTGDIVKAMVTKGKKMGTYVGRVAVRSTGSFNISAQQGLVQGISHKYCSIIHSKDGYN